MTPTKLTQRKIEEWLRKLKGWSLRTDGKSIERYFELPDFKQALKLTNQIGDLAEAANHHPEIILTWGKVTVQLSTHEVNGLTEKDFALAEQIDQAA